MADKTSFLKGPKDASVKHRAVARTMTAGTQVATLPKGSRIMMFTITGTPSDAGTTATLSVGSSATATEYVNGYDVKTAANGRFSVLPSAGSAAFGGVLTADAPIFVKYGETGGASTAGSWVLTIWYTTGNVTNDDTL
jgi:hypothetical protein